MNNNSDSPVKPIICIHDHDVIFQCGNRHKSHTGNKHWRLLIGATKPIYRSLSHQQQALLVKSIVQAVSSLNGRFLIKDKRMERWFDVENEHAEESTKFVFDSRESVSVENSNEVEQVKRLWNAQLSFLKEVDSELRDLVASSVEKELKRLTDQAQYIENPTKTSPSSHALITKLHTSAAKYPVPKKKTPPKETDEVYIQVPQGPLLQDVVLGTGRNCSHPGNTIWRLLISANKPVYRTLSKDQKAVLVQSIVFAVHHSDPPGRFMVNDKKSNTWFEMQDDNPQLSTAYMLDSDETYYVDKTHSVDKVKNLWKAQLEFLLQREPNLREIVTPRIEKEVESLMNQAMYVEKPVIPPSRSVWLTRTDEMQPLLQVDEDEDVQATIAIQIPSKVKRRRLTSRKSIAANRDHMAGSQSMSAVTGDNKNKTNTFQHVLMNGYGSSAHGEHKRIRISEEFDSVAAVSNDAGADSTNGSACNSLIQPRPKPSITAHATDVEAEENDQASTDFGKRVYAEVEGKDWQWGIIADYKDDRFSVLLDDGQCVEFGSRKRFVTVAMYRDIFSAEPPPIPPDHLTKVNEMKQRVAQWPTGQQETDGPFDGKAEVTTTKEHFLVGRPLCLSWADLEGRRQEVDGEVVKCNKDVQSGEISSFTVRYNAQSRDSVNSRRKNCLTTVPESQTLPPPLVLGGCIAYEERASVTNASILLHDIGDLIYYWRWISPDRRREEQVTNSEGKLLPRVAIEVHGYRLELNVKQSTIPNAGYGVFVSCRPLERNDDGGEPVPFVLKAGELIDCGVYAPFSPRDRKLEAVFFAKNFIHSHKCEQWAFTAGDSRYQYDITDDFSGDIHDLAKTHIPAYVNESNTESSICIRAEHSPDSSVHYLLGHSFKTQGDLTIPSDGREMEVFANYGKEYEEVRVRKGYSFLPDCDKKDHLLDVIANENVVDIKEIDRFGVHEMQACITFFSELLSSEEKSKLSRNVLRRTFTCMAVLHRRAWRFFLDECAESIDMKSSLELASAKVLFVLLGMMVGNERDELNRLHSVGDVDGLFRRALELQFSDEELPKLADMMTGE